MLVNLLTVHEEWLIDRILYYANLTNYTKYSSTLREAWKISIQGLSHPLQEVLRTYESIPEIVADSNFSCDPIARFGIEEARKHRSRGVGLEMFLGLFKYYKQSYIDLIDICHFPYENSQKARQFFVRYFDWIEIAFVSEWSKTHADDCVAELQQSNRALSNEKNEYLTIFESLAPPIAIVDEWGNIKKMNFAAAKRFRHASTPGAHYYSISNERHTFHWLYDEILYFKRCGKKEYTFEKTYCDGEEQYVFEITFSQILDVSGKFMGTTVFFNDVTALKASQNQIHYQTYFDGLTRLPNRTLFNDRLSQVFSHAKRSGGNFGVLFIDLDNFKHVNDGYGHDLGDRILIDVAQRLSSCIREQDTVARLGGDEFVILLREIHDENGAVRIAQRIHDALDEPVLIADKSFNIGGCIGVSLYPMDGLDASTLMKNAEIAMYRAKERGKNSYQLFAPTMQEAVHKRIDTENQIRKALDRDEFVVFYQPKIDVNTFRIAGVEALVRWLKPDGRILPPCEFISVAEESGLIVPLGESVLRQACRQAQQWSDGGFPNIQLAVNISARQFQSRGFIDNVLQIVSDSRLDPSRLELELTESTVMIDADETLAMLNRLAGRGIQLSIDDFGTGYSSLYLLKNFPFTTLKVDRSFVRDITSDPSDAAMVETIVSMGRNLKLRVIAEGVETKAQLDFLCVHSCDEVQGYLFSPPVPADEILRMLRDEEKMSLSYHFQHRLPSASNFS